MSHLKIVQDAMETVYDIEISPKNWVLPNRVKFPVWIDKTFKYGYKSKYTKQIEKLIEKCDEGQPCSSTKINRISLFPHQRFIKDYMQFDSPYRGILLFHGLGVGKCHAKNTPILMYNGSIKMVQDVKVGDNLMGDDSTPRKVLSLANGIDKLYEVIPVKGEKYTVNSEHILCLKYSNERIQYTKSQTNNPYKTELINNKTCKVVTKSFKTREEANAYIEKFPEENKYVEISVNDYLNLSKKTKSKLKGYRVPVDFKEQIIDFDPYIIGVWLGDGSSGKPAITNQDAKILHYLRIKLKTYGLNLNHYSNYDYGIASDIYDGNNKFLKSLKKYNLLNNKHIPNEYKINSKEVREQVLAGLIDTDGYMVHKCYEIIQKREVLADDIVFISRSLGFAAYKKKCNKSCVHKGEKITGTYYRCFISGDNLDKLPVKCTRKQIDSPRKQKKDALVTGIKVEYKETGEYFGFILDGNHKYLLGDFTVTHNTAASIGAAEVLMNHMDVIVMLPASLRNNYINEIKNYGKYFYRLKQYWEFIQLKNITDSDLKEYVKILSLTESFIKKKNGLWIPNNSKGKANYSELSKENQLAINIQINNTIKGKCEFINYNGQNREKIKALVANGNPFDNKCIIIDEIHNLISRIVGGGSIGKALYNLLRTAQNCKLILLSGTPIINYPYEISYLINLITGPRIQYELTFLKDSEVNLEKLEILLNINTVDYYIYDKNTRKVNIIFLPIGFVKNPGKKQEQDQVQLIRDFLYKDAEIELEQIINNLKQEGFKVGKIHKKHEFTTLPEKKEDFNKYFVNDDKIVNQNLFMRRILGTVSYYSVYSQDLYPSVEIVDVPVPMNDYQFLIYEKSRVEERKKESNMKFQNKNKNNDEFSNSGQVYRFYSRANCNFVFPEAIKRPFPSTLKQLKKEIDVLDIDDSDVKSVMSSPASSAASVATGTSSSSSSSVSASKQLDYGYQLKEALSKVYNGPYLNKKELAQYSPKFKLILDKVDKARGKCLIYSQFRTVEGLGLLGLSFKKIGYAEIKLKKINGEYDFDIHPDDINKPKYMMFTGSNEETQILLNIFNSSFDNVPKLLKERLKEYNLSDNLRGDIIKTIMITQSGAEGVSLKHVRQVHILEPYWNHIRMDQVIGRAVRTASHVDLPPAERNVLVYIYYSVFSEKQLNNSFTIKTLDKSKTSDEYIYNIAKRKKSLTDGILDMLKKASVDCGLNNKSNNNLKCFSFPTNLDDNQITTPNDINQEMEDAQYKLEKLEFEATIYITKKGNFLVNKKTNEVYDYDIYINTEKLVKLGVFSKDSNGKYTIKFI